MKNILFILVLAGVISSSAPADKDYNPADNLMTTLDTNSQTNIVKVSGKKGEWKTEYRGFTVAYLYEDLLRDAKEVWHANQLRYMMCPFWRKGDGTREQAWEKMIEGLPKGLDNAHELGMSMIIDLHQLPKTSPIEYEGDRDAKSHAWWQDTNNLEIMIAAWRELAAITAARPEQDIWLELYNEPLDWSVVHSRPAYPATWPGWCQILINEIRKIDKVHPIVIETGPGALFWGLRDWPGLEDPCRDLIYSIHVYQPFDYTHQGIGSTKVLSWPTEAKEDGQSNIWNKARIRSELELARQYQLTYGVRIHVGEFSAPRWAPNAEGYLRDCIELFEEYGWDWNYHAFREASVWRVTVGEQVDLYDADGNYVRTGIANPDEGLFYAPRGTPARKPLPKVDGLTKRGKVLLEFMSRNLEAETIRKNK